MGSFTGAGRHFVSSRVALAALAAALASPGVLAQSDAAPEAGKASAGLSLQHLLKGIHADAPIKLPEAVQADLFALLPSARRGEECPAPATVSPDAIGLKDRGEGPVLIAQLTNCQGTFVMAYGWGVVQRVARLADLEEGQTLVNAHALNLRGGKHEDDLGLVLHTGLVREELHLFQRREGFTFADGGVLKEFTERGDCAAGGDVTGGFSSFIRIDSAGRLVVLRVDLACSGGAWQAKCELYSVESGLSPAGVCALPAKLDAKSLRSSGWR